MTSDSSEKASIELVAQSDGDLFELEFGPVSEMSRFLSWETMHMQTLNDVVADLKSLIITQEFKRTG